jgi:RHS repeat-associated protein
LHYRGIGGLLARTDCGLLNQGSSAASAYYYSDAKGNVSALIDASQNIVARYLYDPFGNVLSQSGPLAEANLCRFSSKEAHPSSGLIYYLYRFYEPSLQRWLNRDPIAEDGGVNLYLFVDNAPTLYLDPLGKNVADDLGDPDSKSKSDQKRKERIAYKTRCSEPEPSGLTLCERAKWRLQRAKDCKRMRVEFRKKWYPDDDDEDENDTHAKTIKDLDVAIARLQMMVDNCCK